MKFLFCLQYFLKIIFFLFQKPRPNTDRIFLDIGLKYYVELTTNEAIKFINIKNKLFQQELDILVQKAAKIKAHIKTLLNMIDQLR